ncbi:MAG: hypothetical protein QXK24_00400 [Ignisphaera sp.]|uniref:Uncharacterized protein n=1 Tax=Ignisphaera aggregans TaxID=334771 RepID=A0A7C4D3J0_9CREN
MSQKVFQNEGSLLGEVVMHRIRIKDLEGLRNILEDVKLMEPIYSRFISKPIVRARLEMYEHSGGVKINNEDKRMWVYVSVMNDKSEEYDIALWKILKYASMYPGIEARLKKYIKIE